MTEHTKTPWYYKDESTICDYFGRPVANPGGFRNGHPECRDENAANAAFIVRACNCHDELLEALEAFMHDEGCFCEAAFAGPGTIVRHSDECIAACSAIAKARGEQ